MSVSIEPTFSLSAARNVIKDQFEPKPWIYWTDFLLSYAAGLICLRMVSGGKFLREPHQGFQGTFSQAFFFVATILLFYRAALFIHEIVHQRNSGKLGYFGLAWNLICGIPFLMPSFVYLTHIDHHRRQHFGTERDGEYMPLAHRSLWQTVFYLSWCLVIPLLAVVRFLVLTPLAWVVPGFRKFVHEHASSMVMDPTYIRPLPNERTMKLIKLQEAGCFLFCLGFVLIPTFVFGRLPTTELVHVYLMAVTIIFLNSIRTLGSHRWHNDGQPMSFESQLLDSVNYPQHAWISELWGPVGTRFHALHHLFPSLPYHSLPAAHRRLIAALPENSSYRQVSEPSLTSALVSLWKRNRRAMAKSPKNGRPEAARH